MYHDIYDPDACDDLFLRRYHSKCYLHIKEFVKQLNYLQNNCYVLSLRELVGICQGKWDFHGPCVLLTFDDGLLCHYVNVMPELAKRNFKGCFYFPVKSVFEQCVFLSHKIQFILDSPVSESQIVDDVFDLIGRFRGRYNIEDEGVLWEKHSKSNHKDNWWNKERIFVTNILRGGLHSEVCQQIVDLLFLKYVNIDERKLSKLLYMNSDQIEVLSRLGMEIGSHGYTSQNLATLCEDEVGKELSISYNMLKRFLNVLCESYMSISYPNGGCNDLVMNLAQENNFNVGFIVGDGRVSDNCNLLSIPRVDAAQYFWEVFSA